MTWVGPAFLSFLIYIIMGLGAEIMMPFNRDGNPYERSLRILVIVLWPVQLLIIGLMVIWAQFEKEAQ